MGENNASIRCICGIEDDDGFTVQCEACYAWQHAKCFGYPNGDNLPEVYYCEMCDPRPYDAVAARELQLRTRDDSRDPMAPPAKPKRKPNPTKPRSKDSAQPGRDGDEDDYFRVQPWELEYTPLKDNLVRGIVASRAIAKLRKEQTPEAGVDGADFNILAPPLPPVYLSGSDLESLAAQTYLRPVDDPSSASCYLPLKYIEPSQNIYARPTIYGVFVSETARPGTFLGEYRCEVLDAAAYRKDPINQYAALGIPKPYVHSVGPPVNLVLDARSYGNEMRFVRSGCHPNAVIRPVFFRASDPPRQRLHFGIFAARELGKNEEIVLGWEWDDQHVVHTLRSVIDSTLTKSASKPPVTIEADTVAHLTSKFDAILTNIFSTFQSCACTVNTDCAFAQMRRQVTGQTFHGVSGARARKRIDLGELIGAVRGWRKREIEEIDAYSRAKRFRNVGEWDLWRAGPSKPIDDEDDEENKLRSRPSSERHASHAPEEMPADEEARPSDEQVEQMDVEPHASSVESAVPSGPGEPAAPVEQDIQPPPPTGDAMDVDEVLKTEPIEDDVKPATLEESVDSNVLDQPQPISGKTQEDIDMAEVPRTPNEPQQSSLAPPSSALSSLPPDRHERHEEGEDEIDDGYVSNATTVTVALGSEGEMSSPTKQTAAHRRRVVSPGPAQRKDKSKKKAAGAPDRRAGKAIQRRKIIRSSDEEASDNEPATPKPAPKSSPQKPKPSKSAKRPSKVSKVAGSESDDEDDTPARKPARKATGDRAGRRSKVVKDSEDEDHSPKAIKIKTSKPERQPTPPLPTTLAQDSVAPEVLKPTPEVKAAPEIARAPPEPIKEEPVTLLPGPDEPTREEQTIAPSETEPVAAPLEAAPQAKEATPPAHQEPPVAAKESPPPPKEPTPPPRAPTPPVPKKVSLKDYLASHKIRKKEKSPEPKVEEEVAVKEEAKEEAVAEIAAPPPSAPPIPTQSARLNFLEHLPSARSATATPTGTPFTPSGASAAGDAPRSSAFVPRSETRPDYFNSQPVASSGGLANTPAFVPRPSPNFVPRGSMDDSARDPVPAPPAFQPRQQDNESSSLNPAVSRPSLPLQTPPSRFQTLPEIPSALPVRDGPPHHGRAPPSGPRHPPTGPRGNWGGGGPSHGPGTGANAAGGPVSPVNSMRGGFGGGRTFRGGFDRGYGFRGRGGPPRGGRGGRM
ncbi:uncharacterized protein COLE_03548 [Cutaneotrichosporon oleaginosum]|uniref:uncharacterized protein n=1 Tax=Cutaneotrichosporon oleaginosum TaxID=879819 RepID=UPI001328C1C7|nr:hypothetical protein COLE_03548 [Cutaneotrichosporon oleaginosum]